MYLTLQLGDTPPCALTGEAHCFSGLGGGATVVHSYGSWGNYCTVRKNRSAEMNNEVSSYFTVKVFLMNSKLFLSLLIILCLTFVSMYKNNVLAAVIYRIAGIFRGAKFSCSTHSSLFRGKKFVVLLHAHGHARAFLYTVLSTSAAAYGLLRTFFFVFPFQHYSIHCSYIIIIAGTKIAAGCQVCT
jgi:hypothetical protein